MGFWEDFRLPTWEEVKDIGRDVVSFKDPFIELAKDTKECAEDVFEEFRNDPIKATIESVEIAANTATEIATLPIRPVTNFAESFVNNVFYDKVTPIRGSILYVDLAAGYMEHSGVYIGDDQIVELNQDGEITIVSPAGFASGGTGFSIYVSCHDGAPVGSEKIAERAEQMIGTKRDYNLIFNNCHIFTSYCLTGNSENTSSFLWEVKCNSKTQLSSNEWRIWGFGQ